VKSCFDLVISGFFIGYFMRDIVNIVVDLGLFGLYFRKRLTIGDISSASLSFNPFTCWGCGLMDFMVALWVVLEPISWSDSVVSGGLRIVVWRMGATRRSQIPDGSGKSRRPPGP
jgi:hypothetical protein